MSFHVPNQWRVRTGKLASDDNCGNNGAFMLNGAFVIASDGEGWEHVSVSRKNRIPTWPEMCQIKNIFWDTEDAVMQLHPPQSDYVNVHPNCLHLWRPTDRPIPLPPSILVGPK